METASRSPQSHSDVYFDLFLFLSVCLDTFLACMQVAALILSFRRAASRLSVSSCRRIASSLTAIILLAFAFQVQVYAKQPRPVDGVMVGLRSRFSGNL